MKRIVISSVILLSFLFSDNGMIQFVNNSKSAIFDVYINNDKLLTKIDIASSSKPYKLPNQTRVIVMSDNYTFKVGALDLMGDNMYIAIIDDLIIDGQESRGISFSYERYTSYENPSVMFNSGNVVKNDISVYLNDELVVKNFADEEFSNNIEINHTRNRVKLIDDFFGVVISEFSFSANDITSNYATIMFQTNNNELYDSPYSMRIINFDGSANNYVQVSSPVSEQSRETNEFANVQLIHNSPYPVVDIYVDNTEALGDVPYRATTGMIQLPTTTSVGIAPANGNVIADFPFTLEANANYVVSASGILGNDETPFGLVASGLELSAVDTNHFGLKVFHGVTDAPAVDIYANGSLLVENLSYNEYKGYAQVPVGDYTIDVTAHGSDQSVASFAAPLSGFGGGTGIVFASGFLASQSDSSFSLILATPSGYSVSLPATPTALSTIADNIVSPSVFKLKQNYPNPFNPSTSIDFEVFESSEVSLSVYDLSGRLVKNLLSSNLNSGAYSVEWNGKNTNGVSAAAGVYFYSISSKESTIIKKMSLIK